MDTPPSDSSGKLWLLPFLLLGVAASLLAVFWFAIQSNLDKGPGVNPPPPVVAPVKLSRDESLKLLELRNYAIGHHENLEFPQADAALTEIIRLLPDDPFGPRNLAICRQLAFDKLDRLRDESIFRSTAASTIEAVEQAKKAEPKSPVPWVIASRMAVKQDQSEQALKDLREAIQINPDSVGAAYDLFTLLQASPGEAPTDEAVNALRMVYQHEQNNLFVIKDILPILAQRHDPSFASTLEQVQNTIAPFIETIKVNTRVDLNDIMKKAAAAAGSGDWAVAQRSTTIIKNLIISEAARDKRFVQLDSLEYVLPEFGEEFRSRADLPDSSPSASKPVRFIEPADPSKWPGGEGMKDVVAVDLDLHGRLELLVLQEDQLVAWGRPADELPWGVLTKIETGGAYTHLLACDFDDDVDQELKSFPGVGQPADALKHEAYMQGLSHTADPDVILFGPAGLKLLENKKTPNSEARSFVARSAGQAFDKVRDVTAAAVADIDNDGDLDLMVSTPTGIRIFSNRGNLTFDEITQRSSLPESGVNITAFAIMDWDRDTDIDIVIATDSGAGWLENIRHGRLRYRPLENFSAIKGATSLIAEDFDGNLSWDLVAAGPSGASVVATDRTPAGLVTSRPARSLASTAVRLASSGDFDNNGATDVILLGETGATVFSGDGQCGFKPVSRPAEDWLKPVQTLAVSDLDRDGDLDLITIEPSRLAFLSSQCRESDNPDNGYLEIQLVGFNVKPGEQNSDKRTNHINLGGMLELKSGQQYQAKVVKGPVSHFGLGAKSRADLIRVLWTNGIPTNVVDPVSDEPISIEQKLHGSCPYLYTWDGERFVFATDLLWNAPLGLKFAETVIAPWREWEYLKIDGEKLKPVQNEYQLRVTAELWEAEYFDEFRLFAIDHPEGTAIFTNEKVGPAVIAEPKIHTVRTPRIPVAARDTRGRDILDQVASLDGNYTKTFDRKLSQGFTEEHYLELDLGKFPPAKNVMLYLTGWMYPGSTSLSVQHSQNPDLPIPRPPAILMPDAQGKWREVRPFMGFPGGKTKTIAVDLSELMISDDHRLRIISTMEIFWDHVFFTMDDAPVEFRQTELKLSRAELVDRGGVSFRSWPASGNGPDQFDYQNLIPGEAWPPMSGDFTKYGDVLPLLTARDDQLVISGSGDEIRLAFAESSDPVPPGWKRDFVLYSVGWDKDADLNTVYGDTVEPMPFEAMKVYGEQRPLDPAYVEYLRKYQTRQRNPNRFWNSARQWTRN